MVRNTGGRFNSIVVRLKDFFCEVFLHRRDEFQFHSGSIKRWVFLGDATMVARFQFHSGSIKRLTAEQTTAELTLFQFHSGSIKRMRD